MRRAAQVIAAMGLSAAFAAAALAQGGASAQDVVKLRHENYKQVGGAFKAIGDQLKTGNPDLAVIKPAAAKLKALSAQLPTWFPAGSGPGPGVKTGAKPEIWTDAVGFAAAAKTFADASGTLDQAAQAGNIEAVKAAATDVGKACGACHNKYREKDHH